MKIEITGSAKEIVTLAIEPQRERNRTLCPEVARKELEDAMQRLHVHDSKNPFV